jgi:hypothetical protein
VPLDDALASLVLLRDDERRFDRAVVRWHARFCLEIAAIGPSEAQLGLAALRHRCSRPECRCEAGQPERPPAVRSPGGAPAILEGGRTALSDAPHAMGVRAETLMET